MGLPWVVTSVSETLKLAVAPNKPPGGNRTSIWTVVGLAAPICEAPTARL